MYLKFSELPKQNEQKFNKIKEAATDLPKKIKK